MSNWIEEEIFKKCKADFSLLMDYGFKVDGKRLVYTQKIMKNDFEVEVSFDHEFSSRIYDLSFDEREEYTGYLVKYNVGEFALAVREEYEAVLNDIKLHCCKEQSYLSEQTERIVQYIYDTYKDEPDLDWAGENSPPAFRNPDNRKWYALLMTVDRSKLTSGTGEVEVINLKLNPFEIQELLNKKGYYPCFHMNKKNWISIILDNTLSDEEIYPLLEESHRFTVKEKVSGSSWITPANPAIYNLEMAFEESDLILWNQSANINKGDFVYIYVGVPVAALLYKCKVLETDIYYGSSKNERLMKLQLMNTYDSSVCPKSRLVEYGVTNIRGPRHLPEKLGEYLEKHV